MSEGCPVCSEALSSEKGLRDHAWDAHGACHHCGDEPTDREALYTHWLDDHEGELSDEDRKRARNNVGERTVCPDCGQRFSGDAAVRDHAWDAHGVCFLCGEGFDEQASLYKHWLAVHEGDLERSDRERARDAVGPLDFSDRLSHGGPVQAVGGVTLGRRAYLGAGGAVAASALGVGVATGAIGGGGGGGGADTALDGHASTAGLSSQPALGPEPGSAQGTIVAFEDPSCHSCRRFELETLPELKSRHISSGDLSFVYRGVPFVYPWGDPALVALEATLEQSESAFWTLKDFYYQNQGALESGNVRSETRRFLESQSGVDAETVATAIENDATRDAIDVDVDAARGAGVGGTPTFFLFREGSYQTEIVGPQPATVFANALGL